MRAYKGEDFFAVGEYWNGDLSKLQEYLADASDCMSLFDVPLHYQLLNASDTMVTLICENYFKEHLYKLMHGMR